MLIVFTVYVPDNDGLAQVRDLVKGYFGSSAEYLLAKGRDIPALVEEKGGYGWTGNDLFQDYLWGRRGQSSLIVESFTPWPYVDKPRLCLLRPEEKPFIISDEEIISIPKKYFNLISAFLEEKRWDPRLLVKNGQVEKQIRQGRADLAIDIVYSGRTLREEGLIIEQVVFDNSGLVLLTKNEERRSLCLDVGELVSKNCPIAGWGGCTGQYSECGVDYQRGSLATKQALQGSELQQKILERYVERFNLGGKDERIS